MLRFGGGWAFAGCVLSVDLTISNEASAIRGGDAKLAWKLLESRGVTEEVAGGPTDVEELAWREAVEQKKKEIERKQMESRLEMDGLNSSLGEFFP